LLVLPKNQQYLITNNSMVLNQNSIRIFLSYWKKEWLTECQWTVTALTVGPA